MSKGFKITLATVSLLMAAVDSLGLFALGFSLGARGCQSLICELVPLLTLFTFPFILILYIVFLVTQKDRLLWLIVAPVIVISLFLLFLAIFNS